MAVWATNRKCLVALWLLPQPAGPTKRPQAVCILQVGLSLTFSGLTRKFLHELQKLLLWLCIIIRYWLVVNGEGYLFTMVFVSVVILFGDMGTVHTSTKKIYLNIDTWGTKRLVCILLTQIGPLAAQVYEYVFRSPFTIFCWSLPPGSSGVATPHIHRSHSRNSSWDLRIGSRSTLDLRSLARPGHSRTASLDLRYGNDASRINNDLAQIFGVNQGAWFSYSSQVQELTCYW